MNQGSVTASGYAIQPLPAIMDTGEVAQALRCAPETVERCVHRHELDAIQIGKERRFRAIDVIAFIEARPSTRRNGRFGRRRRQTKALAR